jgi:hypothetical protein
MGWDKIVTRCHISLISLTPCQERPVRDTREDIFDGFQNFKPNAQISKDLNWIHFSSHLKRRVQSRLTAVAAKSSASSGAGADAGRKSCWHVYSVIQFSTEIGIIFRVTSIHIRSVFKMFSRPIINSNPCSHCLGCSDEDDDAGPCRTGSAPQVTQAESLVFRHFILLVWDSAIF